MVSQCPSSVVRRQQFALKAYSSYTPGQVDLKLVGSIRVTCRSRIAKIFLMGDMGPIMKICFALLLLNLKAS